MQGVQVGSHNVQINVFGDRDRRVFIADSLGARETYRENAADVCRRLGLTPVLDDPDADRTLEERRRILAGCGVVVLLVGRRYGPVVGDTGRSLGELQYDWAWQTERAQVLVIVVPAKHGEPEAGTGDDERLRRFLERVGGDGVYHRVSHSRELRRILAEEVRGPAVPSADGYAAPPMTPAPRLHAVPRYSGVGPFTGRAEHLRLLDEWAASGDRVLVVEAIGGTGKSALTWEWTTSRVPTVMPGLAGTLWWSFYEGSTSMTRFLREVAAYMSGRPRDALESEPQAELAEYVLKQLDNHPYLLVLDGFERLLSAYRLGTSTQRDEDVRSDARSLVDPQAFAFVEQLRNVVRSKVLISSRLLPSALESRFLRGPAQGVRRIALPGLADPEVVTLLGRLHVRGRADTIGRFFGPLDNHPLLIGVVAGLVQDYRPDPGGFDAWAADPAGGQALRLPDLDLRQRRTHIFDAAFAGLPEDSRQLLGWISVYPGPMPWATVVAISPFDEAGAGRAQLDAALRDLEDRGLLWWDRDLNRYDLHPIIRGYTVDQLDDADRVAANERISSHFEALPPVDVRAATSVEDLDQTIGLFRALVGAGRHAEAARVWPELGDALTVSLGVYATVIELLTPLAAHLTPALRADLSLAYSMTGRYDDAIELASAEVLESLDRGHPAHVAVALSALRRFYHTTGRIAEANECLKLRLRLNRWAESSGLTPPYIEEARYHIDNGDLVQADERLRQAERHAPSRLQPWFRSTLRYYRLYVAMREGTLAAQYLAEAVAAADSLQDRRSLAFLSYEYHLRADDHAAALTAAQEFERLGRDAGMETTPAHCAFPLVRLGRIDEARAAIEESLTRLERTHPAHRPHRALALAYLALDEREPAVEHALVAYRTAWADGPPNSLHWELRDAEKLLAYLTVPPPAMVPRPAQRRRIAHQMRINRYLSAIGA